MRNTPEPSSIEKEFPMMCSARSFSPAPRAMEQSGAPPIPKRLANAVTRVMIGRVRPIPVSACVDVCGM